MQGMEKTEYTSTVHKNLGEMRNKPHTFRMINVYIHNIYYVGMAQTHTSRNTF